MLCLFESAASSRCLGQWIQKHALLVFSLLSPADALFVGSVGQLRCAWCCVAACSVVCAVLSGFPTSPNFPHHAWCTMRFTSGWWKRSLPLHSSWFVLVSCSFKLFCCFIWFPSFPKFYSSFSVHDEIHIWLVKASSPITFVMVCVCFLWFHLVVCGFIWFPQFPNFSSSLLVRDGIHNWMVKASSPNTSVITCVGFLWFSVVSSCFMWFYLVFRLS